MNDEAAAFICGSAWGQHLAPRDLARVLAAVRLTEVPVGHCVVHAGETAEYWIGLVNGLVMQQVSSESGRLEFRLISNPHQCTPRVSLDHK